MGLDAHHDAARCCLCQGAVSDYGPRLDYHYGLCSDCGTLQLVPQPSEAFLREAYERCYVEAGHTEEFSDPARWRLASAPYRADLLKVLKRHGLRGLIAEFGSGSGFLLEDLLSEGYACRGVELSALRVAEATARGLPLSHGGFESIESQSHPRPDHLILCAVFEHLVNHADWMDRFNRVLPMGGYLISLHPTARCYQLAGDVLRLWNRRRVLPELHGSFAPPWHTVLISLKAMRRLAMAHGFEVVDVMPVSQGRAGGLVGLVQRLLGWVNQVGVALCGAGFPLVTTHVFVLKKTCEPVA